MAEAEEVVAEAEDTPPSAEEVVAEAEDTPPHAVAGVGVLPEVERR